jgi:trans-aconitate methyltransferase
VAGQGAIYGRDGNVHHMAMPRVPEPELMDEEAQAHAYSEADFAEAHDLYVANVAARFGPMNGHVVDLGCGPADVTVRFARANPDTVITGIDAGVNMLALARRRVIRAELSDRVRFEEHHLPTDALAGRGFDAVISNSLLHHLPDPMVLWSTIRACTRAGACVAVGDLLRPESAAALEKLVDAHACGAPEVLRDDFANSLAAAYRPDEIRDQLAAAGLDHFDVRVTTDRHLLVTGCL